MPIDRNVFDKCLVDANEDIRDAQKALDPSDRYLSEQYDVTVDGENDYNFNSKTVFLNAYLIGKLNTSLHDKTVSVEHKNGSRSTGKSARSWTRFRRTRSSTCPTSSATW